MLFIGHAFTFSVLLSSNDALCSQNGKDAVMYVTAQLRSTSMSARATNPSVRLTCPQKTGCGHINSDISCLGLFKLLAVIQKQN